MELTFKTIGKNEWIPDKGRSIAFLKDDFWDDYNYKTLFELVVFDKAGVRHDIGGVKIGFIGQEIGRTEIPATFSQLEDKYFSLGQDSDYYSKLKKLEAALRHAILVGLRDIVEDVGLCARALEEDVTKTSLLRVVSTSSIYGQYKRLLQGGALLTEYHFGYKIEQSRRMAGLELDFHIDPDSNPPSNIHVLIGRNGVGKTHLLNNMVRALVDKDSDPEKVGIFLLNDNNRDETDDEIFAGVVSVTFSAFDPFDPLPEKKDKSQGVRYSYVGLKRSTNRGGERGTPMSHDMITNEFVKSLQACFSLGKSDRWKVAIEALESDPLFKEADLARLLELDDEIVKSEATSLFKRMSSGHGIVLLTITKLVEKVEEKTLVLIDEPESHLHPPLLSAFTRTLSELLSHRNGVSIIVTHSPVIVQEVPRSCVWKLRRTGLEANAERPETETFGENVGVLTREIFGLEVTDSGYHKLLEEVLEYEDRYRRIVRYFGDQLGSEAKGIIRGLLAAKQRRDDET